MRRVRRLAAVVAAALMTAVSACAGEPLAPLPVQAAPATTTTAAATPSGAPSGPPVTATPKPPPSIRRTARATTAATVRPTTRATTAPPSSRPSTCFGAVRYDLDLQNTVLDLVPSMCFRAGGVLRLQGIGPGLVTAAPAGLTSQTYAAGVVDLRFLRPGTVTVTVPQDDGPQDDEPHTITVVVIH